LTPDNCAVIFIDPNAGLSQGVADQDFIGYYNGVKALTEIAAFWKLPVIISTPYDDRSIGPIFKFIEDILPNATYTDKVGVTSAFD
jgi:hypothetical protein